MDRNGDKKIDTRELTEGLRSMGVSLSPGQAIALFQTMDVDGNGLISREEFIQSVARERALVNMAFNRAWESVVKAMEKDRVDIEAEFRRIDTDGSGEISMQELGSALSSQGVKLSERELRLLFESIDVSKEGNINYSEFSLAHQRYVGKALGRPRELEQAWDALLSVLTDGQATSEVPPNMRSKYELFRASDVVIFYHPTQTRRCSSGWIETATKRLTRGN